MQVNESLIPLDIILPVHGRPELTKQAVDAIYAHTQSPFHLIVMDDTEASIRDGAFNPISPEDLTSPYFEQLVKKHSNLTWVNSPTVWKTGNEFFNKGFALCKYDFVATVMNSVRVEPDWERVALRLMKDDPTIGIVGIKNLFPSGLIESAGIVFQGHIPTDFGRDQPGHRLNHVMEMQAVQWACALMRKVAVVGALDESLFEGHVGWDDIDNCFAVRARGWRIVYSGAGAAYHAPRASRGNNSLTAFLKNRKNAEVFYKRWGFWDMYKGVNKMEIGDKLKEETRVAVIDAVVRFQVLSNLANQHLAMLQEVGNKALAEAGLSPEIYQLTIDPVQRSFMVTQKQGTPAPIPAVASLPPSGDTQNELVPGEVLV